MSALHRWFELVLVLPSGETLAPNPSGLGSSVGWQGPRRVELPAGLEAAARAIPGTIERGNARAAHWLEIPATYRARRVLLAAGAKDVRFPTLRRDGYGDPSGQVLAPAQVPPRTIRACCHGCLEAGIVAAGHFECAFPQVPEGWEFASGPEYDGGWTAEIRPSGPAVVS